MAPICTLAFKWLPAATDRLITCREVTLGMPQSEWRIGKAVGRLLGEKKEGGGGGFYCRVEKKGGIVGQWGEICMHGSATAQSVRS